MLKIKHLKDKKVGYWEHWYIAMSCSLALFVHAWIPCLFEDYASKNINKKQIWKMEQGSLTQKI